MNWWTLFLAIGATARLTRLVNADTITAPLRRYVAVIDARRRLHRAIAEPGFGTPVIVPSDSPSETRLKPMVKPGPLFEFITCPWCVSVWFGFATIAAVVCVHGWAHACLLYTFGALTASHATGFMADRVR